MEQIICENLDYLPTVANKILKKYPNSKLFLLNGSMGAGKTTLIKLLCAQLCVVEDVSSPTFSIVNEYKIDKTDLSVFHFDFYRLKNIQEALDIGIFEYLDSNNYCFFEWAENIKDILPENIININIFVDEIEQKRTFSF